ncbi:hypothetical protein CHARACLAT_012876 [Characodon lateralis]|uniref:Uncharacterized protein n=1 Tax=Characodon lateralis TaxID=208331 RepID=A0ABU7E9Y3_9TELE|nr:hypothetical protein [Characodon lateralis]
MPVKAAMTVGFQQYNDPKHTSKLFWNKKGSLTLSFKNGPDIKTVENVKIQVLRSQQSPCQTCLQNMETP